MSVVLRTKESASLWHQFGLVAAFALLLTSCTTVEKYSLTYRVWDNDDWRKWSEPAPNPNLALFQSTNYTDVLVQYDAEFHARVARASGNATLASMLAGVSGRTQRARIWRGIVEAEALKRTIAQHEDILRALEARDPALAQATALVHVATTEAWLRRIIANGVAGGDDPPRHARRPRGRPDS